MNNETKEAAVGRPQDVTRSTKPATLGAGAGEVKPGVTITLTAPCGQRFRFKCEAVIDGVPINPELPPRFDDTPNEARSDRSRAWWGVPFVRTEHNNDPKFVAYAVRCLDGGAWDRSTIWGMFGTIEEAVAQAGKGPVWSAFIRNRAFFERASK